MPNDYSQTWFATFLDTVPPESTALEIAFLVRWLPDPPYHRVLDLCCGSGRHAGPLAARGYAVMGVDINAEALARARGAPGNTARYV